MDGGIICMLKSKLKSKNRIDIKKLTPDYDSFMCDGGYGDIYRCIEKPDVLIKIVNNINDTGECNDKIIQKLNGHANIMNIIGYNKVVIFLNMF